ncbi:AAA family ATPase [Actinomyces naeslundii]|uniref:Nuclease SbcCD subunit C n=4 Tax=Actinomyces naeslundii TaxID=1655 RepID=J3JKA2_ACTNH|nr:SMC family ATPase [Actinomyces naeslundii]EJN85179.1 AAA domain protein [Actinomyces naeslundii str. Howell 279]OMG31596.1 exonuclease SbcC [Actinomyces naeslundii]QQC21408.1 SMC family ATPase [Actinomyces naeslundii]
MRIHSLTMTGIGPYAGREHIDFDAVGASGRFLLTGPTGSGKTTIIDAIVFALYGDVADSADSSKERIRSTLVGPHTESVIELVFSTGAGVYRVRRTPTYERAKRRGQGTTTQNGTVKLWHLAEVGGEPLDEPVTRVGDADAEIARAVGLSREQFTQTVVLPQGKFARFLRADSSERQHLLKDVFGTGIYDAIQDALIQASRDGARRVEQAAADLRGQVASLGRHPLLAEAPYPAETADAGEEIEDASHGAVRDDPSQEAPSGGTQEALPLPMNDADRAEPEEADAGPAPTPAQALEAAMAGAAPNLVALRRVGAEALEASRNRVASADARSEAAGTALTRAQSAREEAQSLHDLLERRRALIEENERLAERAEQEADDARRLQDAERASRVRPYLAAEQTAHRRAQQAVAALAARADQSGLAHLAEQAGVTSPGSTEEATGSDADSHGAAVTPAALVEPLVREAQRQLTTLEDQPSQASASSTEVDTDPQDSKAAESPIAADESETDIAEALSPRDLDDLAHHCRHEHGQLETLVGLEAGLPARESALQQREAELQHSAGQLEQRAEKLAERPAQRTALVETLEAARAARAGLEGLQDRRTRAEERHRAALAVEQLSAQLAQRDAACTQAATLAREATERVRATRLAWISGTAGALAGELTEGEPCPVCGSTTHPSPATAGTDGATRQQVEAAEEHQRQSDEALSGAVRERDACATRLQEAQRTSDGMDVAAAKEALEAAATALATARAAADGVEELVERLEAFDAGTEQERAALDTARSAQESARSRMEADREALAQDRRRCLEARETWPSVTARAAALLVRAQEAEDASEDVDTARTALAQARSALADLAAALEEEGFTSAAQATAAFMERGAVEALSTTVRAAATARERVRMGLEDPQIAALSGQEEDRLEDASAELARADAAARQTASLQARTAESHEHLRRAVDGVEQAATAYEEAAGSSADLIRVASLARGENEAGTPLATWVLQARFEEVLVFANERLSQMSSGRYELIRVAEEASQRRRRKGLGLAVVDHLGDERARDPRTLSGGETFYVSLSLALALADVVSAESGGVSLETLFIDEGFGTLDADTLQTVMAEVDHLRAGGRTVGIVSHVAELRDQIAERIAVRRVASGGSTLRVTA